MRSRPTQVEENQEQTKTRPRGEWRGAPGKLSTLFPAGTPGASVIYGPCQVEGGEKQRAEREGLPLGRACETVGPREAAVIPKTLQGAPGNARLTHPRCFSAGGGRREVRTAERVDGCSALFGAQVLSTLEHTQRDPLALPPGRSLEGERGRGWSGLERPVQSCALSPGVLAPSQLPHPGGVGSAGNTKRHSGPSTWAHAEATSFLFFRTTGDRLGRKKRV